MKRSINSKIYELEALTSLLDSNFTGKTIGLCHGVFDVLHAGHLRHFEEANKHVDVLVISVTADEFVNKGPGRPLNDLLSRMETLAGIEYIDFVVESKASSAQKVISKLKPNYYFKGKDYFQRNFEIDTERSQNWDLETYEVQLNNGQVKITNSAVKSSSTIINSLYEPAIQLEQKLHLQELMSKGSIEKIITKISGLKIGVIGEIIYDKYLYTESLGKSGKHPIVAEKEISQDIFLGGVLPVIRTLMTFTQPNNVKLFSLRNAPLPDDICNISGREVIYDCNYTDILKTRFINKKTNTHLFESYRFDDRLISNINESRILGQLESFKTECDLLLTLDFGHGLLTPAIRTYITENFPNVALNVQRNAGNRGFSSIGKYNSAKIIVLNGEEVELELRQKGLSMEDSAREILKKMKAKIVAITDGENGLVLTNGDNLVRIPALNQGEIIDRTGAGDVLFAILSIVASVTEDLLLIGYMGSLAASMNLTWLANQQTITKADLLRYLQYSIK
jgi:cytidyltransferase-like protein